ncbi:MAG TPA: capsule assembly Wzi family protein [bacterium]|nr:capsule assembly Wzi family protein [bacterium]
MRGLALVLFFPLVAAATLPAATVPLDHWVYGVADQLIERGLWPGDHVSERPWDRAYFAACAGKLTEDLERGNVWLPVSTRGLLERLVEEFEPEVALWRRVRGPADALDRERLRDDVSLEAGARVVGDTGYHSVELTVPGGAVLPESFTAPDSGARYRARGYLLLGAGYGDEVALYARGEVDTDGLDDPDWRGMEWKGGLSVQFDLGYLRWTPTEWFSLSAGREPLQWGYSLGGSTLLSGKGPALDGFRYAFDFWNLRFSYFHAGMDSLVQGGVSYNRYLVGHRLSWQIVPEVEVGLGEATVYGGEGRSFSLAYLNPLTLHYLEQFSESVENDNPFWLMDFDARPIVGVRLWGQFMVDDFQYENDKEPPEIAFLAGASWADPLGLVGFSLGVEYVRVWNWVYNVVPPYDRLLFLGRPLGFPRGNDTDRWSVLAAYSFGPDFSLDISATLDRHGEGRIEDDWAARGFTEETFPSGVVESSQDYRLDFAWHPSRNLATTFTVGYRDADDLDNVEGAVMNDFYVGVRADYLFELR